MKKPCYVLATHINGEWFFINKEEHYDWEDTFKPTDSIWSAAKYNTEKEAKKDLKRVLKGKDYFEQSLVGTITNQQPIKKDVWKVYEIQMSPLFTEVK